jgi:hypothetical protein
MFIPEGMSKRDSTIPLGFRYKRVMQVNKLHVLSYLYASFSKRLSYTNNSLYMVFLLTVNKPLNYHHRTYRLYFTETSVQRNSGHSAYGMYSLPSRKVTGLIPDGLSNWPNPSSCSMALGSTRPLTEMSARNLPGW